jgi:hypothetical protein
MLLTLGEERKHKCVVFPKKADARIVEIESNSTSESSTSATKDYKMVWCIN